MNKDLLHSFFKGNTNLEEEKEIRNWFDMNEANRSTFFRERKVYDSILLTLPHETNRYIKNKFLIRIKTGVAAASIFLLLVTSVYIHFMIIDKKSPSYNTIIVPPGQHIHMILTDNTAIWLNANSKFRYQTDFSRKDRTVYLDGEAYFEVSKNEKKPFWVKTPIGDIKVTGTTFNVEAYSEIGELETSLFEGGVEIHNNGVKLATLQPNEKGTINNDQIVISQITDTDEFLWKNGLIAFKDKKLEEILHTLGKHFDVDFQIETSTLSQHTYTGKFRLSDGVDYALRVLQKSIRFTYERDDLKGIIYIQ